MNIIIVCTHHYIWEGLNVTVAADPHQVVCLGFEEGGQ